MKKQKYQLSIFNYQLFLVPLPRIYYMPTIANIVQAFEPISLSEMESVKLMNRIDTKYAVPRAVLPAILEAAQADY